MATPSIWKGKQKAQPQDFDETDLDPVVTYRHLLSQNLGVRDPLRVIALCDSDAFYANCEMVRLGTDKETPLIVLQWDAMIAINYPARKLGLDRRMTRVRNVEEFKKKYPGLQIVHVATYREGEEQPGYWDLSEIDTRTHKVSLDYYRRESFKIAALFKEVLPGCEIEKASIDEAFFDFTKLVKEAILERFPHLGQVPADSPSGIDTPLPPPPLDAASWDGLGNVIPINPPPPVVELPDPPAGESAPNTDTPETPSHQMVSESNTNTASETPQAKKADNADTVYIPEDATKDEECKITSWHDVALSIAAGMMLKARETVLEKLGYSTSAGLARNKFLAKLTASYKKPMNQSILRNKAIPAYLRPIPFQKIRFLGGKLGTALAEEFEVSTVGDLQTITLDEMQSKFGEDSLWIWEILRGIDRSEVKEKKSPLTKSMLASKNLPKPITDAADGYHWIRVLAAELALRLKEAREAFPNLWPKSIVLRARKGYEPGRSRQAPFPFTTDITVDYIAAAGDKLWKELVGTDLVMKVTSVSLSFTGIEGSETGQRSIEGFFKPPSVGVSRSRQVNNEAEELLGSDTEEAIFSTNLDVATTRDGKRPEARSEQSPLSFTCSRCNKELWLSTDTILLSPEEQKAHLAIMENEHSDFHFAQDLANEGNEAKPISGPSKRKPASSSHRSPKKKKRKAAPSTGIESFFRRA